MAKGGFAAAEKRGRMGTGRGRRTEKRDKNTRFTTCAGGGGMINLYLVRWNEPKRFRQEFVAVY